MRLPKRDKRHPDVVLAASGGGHFDLLSAISRVVSAEREWVTVAGPRSLALSGGGEVVHVVPTFDLDHFNLSNLLRSLRLALRLRPKYIITTGAGVVLTFTVVAWMLGAKVVFIETMARVALPSKTGRVLARISDLHVVQWPELAEHFPRAVVCWPALLPQTLSGRSDGEGTFVSLGTHPSPFYRLLDMVDEALETGLLPQPCSVQGPAQHDRYPHMSFLGGLSPKEFRGYLRGSRYVLGHAGAGFISASLSEGRRPIVLARRSSLGEHVDDHQLQLAEKLSSLGLVVNAQRDLNERELRETDAPLEAAAAPADLVAVNDVIERYLAAQGLSTCADGR